VVGVPTQSSKGLRVRTKCRDVEEFVQTFHRFCEDSAVFISHARRSVGEVVAFSFELADGTPALSGLGAVIEHFATADNRFGRPGVVIALHRLVRSARRVFDDLTRARTSARQDRTLDQMPLAEARAVTSIFQAIDPETLTPMPQLAPRPGDASPALAKPFVAPAPEVAAVPLRTTHAVTRSIAAIATRPPAKRTPPSTNSPTIAMPGAAAVAHGTSNPPIVAVEIIAEGTAPPASAVASEIVAAAAVDEQPAAAILVGAPPEAVVAPPADAVVEQPDATAEQTARMATPPFGELVAQTPGAPIVETATADEPDHTEAPQLSPPPLELVGRLAEEAGHLAPASVSTPTSAVFDPRPSHAPAPTRWTKRRIWTVAVLAGASLLALGIVIGATLVGRGASTTVESSQAASTPAPPRAAPMPASPAKMPAAAAPLPAAPAPVAAVPPPSAETATTTETASPPPPPAHVAAAVPPARTIAKPPSRPKRPVKRPPRPKRHKHATSSAGCTSLTCL